jgi:uncharacterized membrane protein
MLFTVVLLVAVTAAGMALLWPRAADLPDFGPSPEPYVDGRVEAVEPYTTDADPAYGVSGEAAIFTVTLTSGPDRGSTVSIDTLTDGLPTIEPGDDVKLVVSQVDGQPTQYFIADFERTGALWALGILFIAVVLAVGRWHGLRSLVGLGLSLLVITRFVVPAILAGRPPGLVALVGAMGVMILTLYLTHGIDQMTTAAVVGTSLALAVTIGFGLYFIDRAALTGFSSEEASLARFAVEGLDLRGLVLAGLIIGALGVLDDVTVSQASTVFTLHDTDPRLGVRGLFLRAMKVGRDHIASTVNTLFLAYAGASLALLVLFSTGGLAVGEIVNSEIMAQEIVKTLVGSLGLISAVPATTLLAATLAVRRSPSAVAASRAKYGDDDHGHALHSHAPRTPAPSLPDADPSHASKDPPALPDDLDDEERARHLWARWLEDPDRGQGPPT